jgi:hypothetical protein
LSSTEAPKRYVPRNSQVPVYELLSEDALSVTLKIVESMRAWVIGNTEVVPKSEFKARFVEVLRG